MEEQRIILETAILAKDKGFDIFQKYFYQKSFHKFILTNEYVDYYNENTDYFAPTQSLLQKWLREVHDIHITIYFDYYTFDVYVGKLEVAEIELISTLIDVTPYCFTKYEDALEIALQEALKLIKI